MYHQCQNIIRVSNSLDPDQARHFVWPDLVPNCLQKLSAADTCRQRVKPPVAAAVVSSTTMILLYDHLFLKFKCYLCFV